MKPIASVADLPDRELLAEVKRLAQCERDATVALVSTLAEFDARRLYLGEGCSSLFTYCTQVLHLSEHAAYGRIEAARAARSFPAVLDRLAAGELTLTALSLLRPHLTAGNCQELLDAARHKTKREVELVVASIAPKPDARAVLRRLPAATTQAVTISTSPGLPSGETPPPPPARAQVGAIQAGPALVPPACARPSRPVLAPLAAERYKLQVTIGKATHDKLRRAQALLRHAVPDGDPAEILDRALTLLIEHAERTKLAAAKRERSTAPSSTSGSRNIPASVRRAVWKRDAGRCAFNGREGRCGETGFLEYHHVVPFARGGPTTAENIELRCRAHNQYEVVESFGTFVLRETPDSVWTELD